jgi:hypothetical protein
VAAVASLVASRVLGATAAISTSAATATLRVSVIEYRPETDGGEETCRKPMQRGPPGRRRAKRASESIESGVVHGVLLCASIWCGQTQMHLPSR